MANRYEPDDDGKLIVTPIPDTPGLFGNGKDGRVRLRRWRLFTTFPLRFARKRGNVYSLTRDVQARSLVVGKNVVVLVDGHLIKCTGQMTTKPGSFTTSDIDEVRRYEHLTGKTIARGD